MRVTVLAGGVGSARMLAGVVRVVDPDELTVVVNTGDDERIRSLTICPDVDTVLYHLSGECDWERGWGVRDETFVANERYTELAARTGRDDLHEWFALGDRDLATHLLRARVLDRGGSLTEATDVVRRAMGIRCRVLPMSDDPVRTMLRTASGETLDFQEYFVHRHQADEVVGVEFAGADRARPAPGVLDAIGSADVVLIPPSNPLISVAPVLAVPGVRDSVSGARGVRVAVSPIVGGRALKGPADRMLGSLGHEVSPVGVARIYQGLVDVFVLDATDERHAAEIEGAGMRALVCDTIMRSPEDAARLTKTILSNAR